MTNGSQRRFATRLIHGSVEQDRYGAVATPIYETATFAMADFESHEAIEDSLNLAPYYSRGFNPTVHAVEVALAGVEGAQAALLFNSGMAAISTVALTLARNGRHLLVSDSVFSTSVKWFNEEMKDLSLDVSFADFSDLEAVAAAMQHNTAAIFFEEFTNPMLKVLDLDGLIDIAHRGGALAIVDNTFASPSLFRPIEHGADLVVHSATKYLSGHGRVLGGAVSGAKELIAEIAERRRVIGTTITPRSAASILDGMHTLDVRVERASASAFALAEMALKHAAVRAVHYPGLPENQGHEFARRLTPGRYGGMLSFALKDPARRSAVYDRFELITRATSLGDVKSLVDVVEEDPAMLRISVGLEAYEDLADDLRAALDTALES